MALPLANSRKRIRLNDGDYEDRQRPPLTVDSLHMISFEHVHNLKKKDIKSYESKVQQIMKQLKGKEIQVALDKRIKERAHRLVFSNGERWYHVVHFDYVKSSKIRGSYRNPSQINEVSFECELKLRNCCITMNYELSSERDSYHRTITSVESVECKWDTSHWPHYISQLMFICELVFESIWDLKGTEMLKKMGAQRNLQPDFRSLITNAARINENVFQSCCETNGFVNGGVRFFL
eukprot:1058290_1